MLEFKNCLKVYLHNQDGLSVIQLKENLVLTFTILHWFDASYVYLQAHTKDRLSVLFLYTMSVL